MKIADLAALGILPLQHHQDTRDAHPNTRWVVHGVRVTGRDKDRGFYKFDKDTFGPVHGGLLWYANRAAGGRIPLWGHAFAARLSDRPVGNVAPFEKQAIGLGGAAGFAIPIRQPNAKGQLVEDASLVSAPVWTPNGIQVPSGTSGVVVPGTSQDEQYGIFLPAFTGLVADYFGGAPYGLMSTPVWDIKPDTGELDPDRRAPLHRLIRTFKIPSYGLTGLSGAEPHLSTVSKGESLGNSLAIQLGRDTDGLGGFGFVADRGDFSLASVELWQNELFGAQLEVEFRNGVFWRGIEQSVSSFLGHATTGTSIDRAAQTLRTKGIAVDVVNGNYTVLGVAGHSNTFQSPRELAIQEYKKKVEAARAQGQEGDGKQVLASLSCWLGGFVDVGLKSDIHYNGSTEDGERLNAAHISTQALFRHPLHGQPGASGPIGGDGPLEFDILRGYPQVSQPAAGFATPVHLVWDPNEKHSWGNGRAGRGLWRWFCYQPIAWTPPSDAPVKTPTGGGWWDPDDPDIQWPGGKKGGGGGGGDPPGGPGTGGGPGKPGQPKKPGGGFIPPIDGGKGGKPGGLPKNPEGVSINDNGQVIIDINNAYTEGNNAFWMPGGAQHYGGDLEPSGPPNFFPGAGGSPPPPPSGKPAKGQPVKGKVPARGDQPGKKIALGGLDSGVQGLYTPAELHLPGIIIKPQRQAPDAPDLRNDPNPNPRALAAAMNETPAVARLEGYGAQTGGGWNTSGQRPRQGRYSGGTAAGGLAFMPAALGMEQVIGDVAQIPSGQIVQPDLTLHQAGLAFGTPTSKGGVASGQRLKLSGGEIVVETTNSSGTTTSTRALDTAAAIQTGTLAARPSATAIGQVYIATDACADGGGLYIVMDC